MANLEELILSGVAARAISRSSPRRWPASSASRRRSTPTSAAPCASLADQGRIEIGKNHTVRPARRTAPSPAPIAAPAPATGYVRPHSDRRPGRGPRSASPSRIRSTPPPATWFSSASPRKPNRPGVRRPARSSASWNGRRATSSAPTSSATAGLRPRGRHRLRPQHLRRRSRREGRRPDDKVVFEMVRFPSPEEHGEGVITEVLGPRGQPGVDTLSVIRAFNLPDEFPEDAQAEAREAAAGLPRRRPRRPRGFHRRPRRHHRPGRRPRLRRRRVRDARRGRPATGS